MFWSHEHYTDGLVSSTVASWYRRAFHLLWKQTVFRDIPFTHESACERTFLSSHIDTHETSQWKSVSIGLSPPFSLSQFLTPKVDFHRLLICFLTILCIYLFSFYFSHIMNFQRRLVLYVVPKSNGFGVFRHSRGFGAELQSFDNKRYWNDDFIEVFHIMGIIPFLIRNDRLIP